MQPEKIFGRIRRALMLDRTAFEEARDDAAFTPIAAGILALTVIISAVGSFLWAQVIFDTTPDDWFLENFVIGSIVLIVISVAALGVAYAVLSQVYKESVTPDAMLRVMSLGYTPFAISVLIFIPAFGFGFGLIAVALSFYYIVFGFQAAWPNVAPMRILVSCIAGLAVWALVTPFIVTSDNPWGPGPFVYDWSEDVLEEGFGGGGGGGGAANDYLDCINDADTLDEIEACAAEFQ